MSSRIDTDQAAQPVAAYSQAVQAGDLLFVSGQIPLNPQTNTLISSSMESATAQCIANAEAILKAAWMGTEQRGESFCFLDHHGRLC
jgi:2-iminobutanoate/2-iminopropanoate deaminase